MAKQQAQRVAFARSKREPPRRRQVGWLAGEFRKNACKRTAAQRFFHRPQRVDRARHAQHEETRRREAKRIETRAIRCAGFAHREVGRDPKRLPVGIRTAGERKRKPGGGGEMARGRRRQLVQRAASQATAERRIDRADAQAQGARRFAELRPEVRVDLRQRAPKLVQRGRRRGHAHGSGPDFVHVLF